MPIHSRSFCLAICSRTPLSESPTTPYTRLTPAATRVSTRISAMVFCTINAIVFYLEFEIESHALSADWDQLQCRLRTTRVNSRSCEKAPSHLLIQAYQGTKVS